jgi:hypothetical protein
MHPVPGIGIPPRNQLLFRKVEPVNRLPADVTVIAGENLASFYLKAIRF